MQTVLVIYAHPNHNVSRLNKALINEISDINGVTISDLYKKYPDGKIDVLQEQSLMVANSLIILQYPMHWFNTTPLLKAWIDEVFIENFAYGASNKLINKQFMCCITIGGSKERYSSNPPGLTLLDLLKPFEYTAKYCSMNYRRPFVVPNFNADSNTVGINDANLHYYAVSYREFLQNYLSIGDDAFKTYSSVD
jgi:glutathione-regulated potassium-efflux system ancillary protein KefG